MAPSNNSRTKNEEAFSYFLPVHHRLPVSLWTSFLELLALGSPLAAHTVDTLWSRDSLRLQALGGLLEGEVDGLALLQAAEAFHVQLALKGKTGPGFSINVTVWGKVWNPVLRDRWDRKRSNHKWVNGYFNIVHTADLPRIVMSILSVRKSAPHWASGDFDPWEQTLSHSSLSDSSYQVPGI